MSWVGGFGVVGLGDPGKPAPFRTRPDLCATHDHPTVTYNPWHDESWCLCGEKREAGNTITWPKADGIGGPLLDLSPPSPVEVDLFGGAA